jgi:hypothetical protein
MFRMLPLVLALAGCTSAPDEVKFESFSGAASQFNECHCQYEDGSTGSDPSIQVLCLGGGEVETMTMFVVPGVAGQQGALLLLQAKSAEYKGGGTGQAGMLGDSHHDGSETVRGIDGLEFSWAEQDTCSVDHGCIDAELTTYHLAAGTAHTGAGQCEDLELEIAADAS